MTFSSTAHAARFAPRTIDDLDELLSRPTPGVIAALGACRGDVVVLGAGGKMGPTFCRMLRRAIDELGDGRRVVAVSRFPSSPLASALSSLGVEVIRADLFDPRALEALPDAPNVLYLAGQKFGTRDTPSATWMANVVLPAAVARRYRTSRIVALSTGNVYSLVPVDSGGATERMPPGPIGEYAFTCVGRERVFEDAAAHYGTKISLVRLNYAVDLRYGVLVDIALKLWRNEPVDLRMGYVNVIWQGDACSEILQCLSHCAVPPFVVNVTGAERLSVREVTLELGRMLDREPHFVGREASDALLSDTTLAQALFGRPAVSAETLLVWVAEWVRTGNPTLGKETHFEERSGRY